MKLSSKNSFLKRIACIVLSAMLCLTSFTLAGFAPTLEAEAATSKEVMHFNFNSSISDSINGNSLTVMGWTENASTGEQRSDHYYHRDGGVYGSIKGLNGLNNWILTYKGYSYDSSDDGNSCEIGLGTAVGYTDVVRVTRNGILYVANENKGAMSLNGGAASNSYDSSKINTIVFDYYNGNLKVTVNGSVFGSYTVDSSVFTNVNSLYSGINVDQNVGHRYHFIDDIVATTVDDTSVTKADFETAFTNFESKINGTLYTNIKPAYDAYINARKVYDAYYYGNDITLTNISDALLELEAQTAKLTVWNPVGTAVPLFEGGSVTKTEAYSNLLYSNKINDRQNTEANAGKYDKTYVYNRIGNNQTVMLYDGKNQPKMPVVFVTVMQLSDYHVGTKYRYPYMAYPTSGSDTTDKFSDLYLEDKWYYKESYSSSNESSCWNFNNIYGQTNARVGNGPTSLQAGAEMSKYGSGWTNLFPYTNVLVYNNQKVFENDDTGAYSKKYNLWWVFGDQASGKTSIDQLKISRCQVDDNSAIYVVNYQPLRKLIEDSTTNIPNSLKNVKQGGLSNYLNILNEVMSFNPNDSFSGVSSVTDGINNFNSAMATNMTKATSLENTTILTDNSAYDTIRTEIVNYRTIQTNNSYNGYSLNDYTDASKTAYTNAYNAAVNYMALVDNNGYDLTTDKPNEIANALLNARNGLTLKSFTINFKYANGDITDGTSYTIYTAGTAVQVPANTKADYDDNYHYSYSWPTIETVTADKTYEEIKTPIGHTLSVTPVSDYQTGVDYKNMTYTHSYKCTDCDYVSTTDCTFTNQGVIDENGKATVTCSVCGGTYLLDYSAYNAELEVLDSMLAETNKYSNTAECKIERDTVNDSAIALDILTQAQVDEKKNAIQEIENKLTLQQYSITFDVATVDGKVLASGLTGTGTYDYGTMVELDLPEEYQTDYVVTSWKRNAQGEDKVVGATSTKLYVIVNQVATYTAVINSVSTGNAGENQAVVTLNNKSGKIVDVGYVETNKEQTVTVNTVDSKITIGSVELTAPTYSFYTLKGFYIDGTLYSETGGTVTITEATVITPYYEATAFVNINRASGETFTINNQDTNSYPAKWNQKITLKSSTEVMWCDENDVVLAQGTTYSFYANETVTIKTKEVTSVDPTASIGYFDYDSVLNKVTVVNNFFVPSGKTVTEAGVILSTKNSTVDALKKQTNGIFEGDSNSFTSTGNQIRISVSRTATTSFKMYALAYVVVDGTTYYANEVATLTYDVSNS